MTGPWRNLRLLLFMKGVTTMLEKIIDFVISFLLLSSPYDWMLDIFKDARRRSFRNPLRELEIAENHFNFCEQEYVSAAIFDLRRAEDRVIRMTGGTTV